MFRLLILAIIFIPLISFAQDSQDKAVPEDREVLDYFVGAWDDAESGLAGIGKGDRTYEFIMDGKHLYAKNRSRFEPQEKNPKGETHEDRAFFSYDGIREKVVLR